MPSRPAAMSVPGVLPAPPQEPDVDEQFSTPARQLQIWEDTPVPEGVTPHRSWPTAPSGDVNEGDELRPESLFPPATPGTVQHAYVHVVHHVTETVERAGTTHVERRVPCPGPLSQPFQLLPNDENRRRAIVKNLAASTATVSLARRAETCQPLGGSTFPLEAGQTLEIKDRDEWWMIGETGVDNAATVALSVTRDDEDDRGPDNAVT